MSTAAATAGTRRTAAPESPDLARGRTATLQAGIDRRAQAVQDQRPTPWSTPPVSTWIDKQLATFPRSEKSQQFHAHGHLMAIAHYARENSPDDPQGAYLVYCERILKQDGADEQLTRLVLDNMDAAWEDDQKHPVFVPLALESTRSRLSTILLSNIVTNLLTKEEAARGIGSNRWENVENVACLSSAVAAYNALRTIARDRCLPYHAIPVGLSDLAKVMGYVGPQGTPDASNALKAIRAAEAANILVTIAKGAPCGKDVPAHLRRSNIYCLRASFETLEAAVADGKQQWPYLERMKLEAPVTDPVNEPVFVSDLPPVVTTSCEPRPTANVDTPAAKVPMPQVDFVPEVEGILTAELPPYLLPGVLFKWNDTKLLELFEHQHDPVLAARLVIEATLAAHQPVGAPF